MDKKDKLQCHFISNTHWDREWRFSARRTQYMLGYMLDMLLDIPRLNGIQWTAGDGKPELTDPCWFDMYKKIQDKKKNIVLLGAIRGNALPEVERLIKTLDPTGLYLSGWVGTADDCERFVETVARWCE